MPEGPEVKKVTDFLRETINHDIIVDVKINSGRYKKHGPFDGYHALKNMLPAKVTFVSCKGKFIWAEINNSLYLTSTLGMTGSWGTTKTKHSHVTLVLSNGSEVYFNDVRNFGTIKVFNNLESFHKKLNSIGPDLLSGYMLEKTFRGIVKTQKQKTITEVLMNQKLMSGIGNYLKAECLYASCISPHRSCGSLSDEEINLLFENCRTIIRRSYELGGATIQSYRQPGGEPGMFSRRFAVYGQKQDPEGREVIKEKTRDGRTTHWVPEVQV
tara:strand:- start:65 stop:874 length:810 start_codon:yes stop_codon:yes gene_type:complete